MRYPSNTGISSLSDGWLKTELLEVLEKFILLKDLLTKIANIDETLFARFLCKYCLANLHYHYIANLKCLSPKSENPFSLAK